MTRRTSNQKSAQFRRMMRLVLSVSVVPGSIFAGGQTLVVADSPTAECMSTLMDVPPFPCSEAELTVVQGERLKPVRMSTAARIALVQRWLGLGQRVDFISRLKTANTEAFSSSAVPTLLPAGDLVAETSVPNENGIPCGVQSTACNAAEVSGVQSDVHKLPPLTIGSPIFTNSQPVSQSRQDALSTEANNPMVVTASATENSGAVVEILSDKQGDASLAPETVDPIDLMNSLDFVSSSETDLPTALSFSDRKASELSSPHLSPPTRSKLPSSREPAPTVAISSSREPQIVNAGQSIRLQSNDSSQTATSANTTKTKGRVVVSSLQESNPRCEVTCSQPAQQTDAPQQLDAAQQADGSSRRSARPEPLKIEIVGQSSGNSRVAQNVAQREPLVAILANYPSAKKSEGFENQCSSLKEMIQADRDKLNQQLSVNAADVSQQLEQTISRAEPVVSQPDATVVNTDRRYSVGIRELLQLKSENTLQGISVEKEEICQLIQTGPKSYSLIGLKEGATRVALITDVSGEQQIEIFQVFVGNRAETGSDLQSLADSIGQTINQLYPWNRVSVEPQDQRLVVRGKVDSEESARKIIALVRKTVLTPVVDQLTTY